MADGDSAPQNTPLSTPGEQQEASEMPPHTEPAMAPAAAAELAAAPVAQQEVDAAEELTGLPPDHPLLRRAQEALHRQLVAQKLRLQEELRERRKALKDSKQQREDVGVELYGFQQHLAKLQMSLERAGEEHTTAVAARTEADATLTTLRSQVTEEEAAVAARQAQVDALQRELDRLAAALRAVQAHKEVVAGEVAAAKCATYATEGALQTLEAEKRDQDFLIDSLQHQLQRLGRQAKLQAAALEAQKGEMAAARQFTAAAVADMEAVAFEKKKLILQWRSSLVTMQKRDALLEALQDTLRGQEEQRASILNEAEGYRRQLAQQLQSNEQAGEVVTRLEAQATHMAAQVEHVQQRRAELQEIHVSLQQQLAERQRTLEAAAAEASKLAAQKAALERQQAKLGQEAAAAEQQALKRLGDQTSAEKGAQHTLRDIETARARVREKEAAAEQLRATLDRLEADAAATMVGGEHLAAVLTGLEGALADKAAGVAALEAEMKAGHAEVEAKTRQIEVLTRRYQRLVDGLKDVETGPLEATIANLQREIGAKEAAGRDLQRRWIVVQGQLVAAQADNAELAEAVTAMRAQQAVMQQKRARLDSQLQAQQREAHVLSKSLATLRVETARLNNLLADAAGQRSMLHEDNVVLEGKLAAELKALEGRWVALSGSIEELRTERGEVLAAVVEAEREVLVWERRVQLEKEMQEAVDPAYGNEELAAARREVARLGHTAMALARAQEALVGELERAVEKREVISIKARVAQSQRIKDMSASQAQRRAEELARAAARAEREGRAADGRLEQLGERIKAVQEAAMATSQQCAALQEVQAGVQAEIAVLGREKHKALVATSLKQKEAKRYEEALAGQYKPATPVAAAAAVTTQGDSTPAVVLASQTERARRKQERLRAAVQGLAAAEELVAPQLERVLAHAAVLGE